MIFLLSVSTSIFPLKFSYLLWALAVDRAGGSEFDTQNGFTALTRAVHWGHADCVRLLIDAGADKEARDNVNIVAI